MPKTFLFKINNQQVFQCQINGQQCETEKPNGTRCKNRTVLGTPNCYSHLLHIGHLRIKNSQLPNAGKGLYAMNPKQDDDEIVFKKGQIICSYVGEILTGDQMNERYMNHTAPYGVYMNETKAMDCACVRGVGSLANNNPGHNNATLVVSNAHNTVKLKATKNIRNNTEIFLAYGNRYNHNDNTSHITK